MKVTMTEGSMCFVTTLNVDSSPPAAVLSAEPTVI